METMKAELSRVTFVRAYNDFGFFPDNSHLPEEWASLISSRFAPLGDPESEVNFKDLGTIDGFLFKGAAVTFKLSAIHVRPFNAIVIFAEPQGTTVSDLDWLKLRRQIYGDFKDSPLVLEKNREPCNFFSLWDEGMKRYIEGRDFAETIIGVTDPSELPMRFGAVALISGFIDKEEFDVGVKSLPGLTFDSQVLVSTNMLSIQNAPVAKIQAVQETHVTDRDDSNVHIDFQQYLLIGAHFAIMRLKQSHLRAAINQVSRMRTGRVLSGIESIDLINASVNIEQQAVHLLANMGARDFLSGYEAVPFSMSLLENVGLDEREIERLIQSLQSLSRFTNNVFSAASVKAQRDLNRVGFVLGLLTVIFSAFAITNFHSATASYRIIILVIWVIAMALVFFASRLEKIRSTTRRRPTMRGSGTLGSSNG